MSYEYATLAGRMCLVTFRQHPRVLDDDECHVRVICTCAEVEAVGEQTVSLLLDRVWPHRQDVPDDEGQVFFDPHPPMELTIRSDAILSVHPVDDPDDDDNDEEDDEDEDDEEAEDNVVEMPKRGAR